MRISYNWLKEYLNLTITAEELKDKLTFAGIEVEAVYELGAELKQIIIARIVEKRQHENSDHLSVCQVNDGRETVQVVCGAPNCATGQVVAFAPVGTKVGEISIKRAKLRGVESFGMICSEKELGLSDNHNGIMVLPEDAPIGIDLATWKGLSDIVYEVEITPNRPDLLGMYGVARDLSALLHLPTHFSEIPNLPDMPIPESELSLVNEELEACPRYIARLIKGVTIKESPDWLKQKLTAAGIKSINNVVDITNLVMMEFGHPLHAFDYNEVKGKQIIIRHAKKGEIFPALDNKTYTLSGEELVIADKERAIALAGVIGGQNSHITNETKDIVLEAACFLYSKIRRVSYNYKIFTDSSYRFERNLAVETTELISARATQLILDLAGGTLVGGKLDCYPNPEERRIVALRPERVKKLLTINIDNNTIIAYLKALGLEFLRADATALYFRIPANRKDLTREIDLLEEIMRLHGYNNVESNIVTQSVMDKERFYLRRKVQDRLTELGFYETMNYSFTDPNILDMLAIPDDDCRRKIITVMNPQGINSSLMRTTLVSSLLRNELTNINYGQKDLKLFEINKVFFADGSKLGKEELRITAIMTGNYRASHWKEKIESVDFYDLKGVAEEIITLFHIDNVYIQS